MFRHKVLTEYTSLITLALIGILVARLLHDSVYLVASFTFAAVVCAAMLIAWAAEASQFSISKGLALAIVAIVQTLPEFFVEGTIAWKAGKDPATWLSNVVANFTGANRLLTGLGWPMILFTAEFQRWRNGQPGRGIIALRREQSVEVVFMLGASLYYIIVLTTGTLTIIDSVMMTTIFLVYMWMLSRLPPEHEDPKEVLDGSPLALVKLHRTGHKAAAIGGLFLFSGLVFVFISDPFVESIRGIATDLLGIGAVFFFIQWIAPLLSEFPEKVTAFNWARTIKLAPMALLNFVSSSVNELTLLVAVIPLIFSISLGAVGTVPIAVHSVEILLTMAQSLYACTSLLDLEYDGRNAAVLFGLWLLSTIFVETRLWVSIIFLALVPVEVLIHRRRITAFSAFKETINKQVLRR